MRSFLNRGSLASFLFLQCWAYLVSFDAMSDSQPIIPKLDHLPEALLQDGAVNLKLEQGVVIFRASGLVRDRIDELLEKQKSQTLNSDEEDELLGYEEIDDYLS